MRHFHDGSRVTIIASLRGGRRTRPGSISPASTPTSPRRIVQDEAERRRLWDLA